MDHVCVVVICVYMCIGRDVVYKQINMLPPVRVTC